ncbi:acyl-CoA thioester hydrolase [Salinibacillus kushneri]|uniref:Acyl-CoA thioester hydrolase n=1 Tax=Salinibacillus kushneri TaxID=237682 RepID=A0A1I0AIX7_9BACI|nr:acyl-CoA thioester hydrolase [Salinibacillus kushneri]
MKHECKVKVRASETDALGHVSNISYFIYLEEARIEMFKDLGELLDMESWPFILASTSCDFKQQAYFDEVMTIRTYVSKMGNSSFHLRHKFVNERGLIAEGTAIMVYFDFNKQKTTSIPDSVRQKLEPYIEENVVQGKR